MPLQFNICIELKDSSMALLTLWL